MILELLKQSIFQVLFIGVSLIENGVQLDNLFASQMEAQPCNVIYIYNGPGVEPACALGAAISFNQVLQRNKYTIRFVGPDAVKAGQWAEDAALFVMPGGADLPYLEALTPDGNAAIRDFVHAGGAYLGFCAGAYYASNEVIFAPGTDLQVLGERPLKFFGGPSYGPVLAPYDYQNQSGARVAQVIWVTDEHEPVATTLHCYYNGGGAFLNAQAAGHTTVLGYLQNRPLNLPEDPSYDWIAVALESEGVVSILETHLGAGLTILLSCHPEIPPNFIRWGYLWNRDPHLEKLIPELEATNAERLELMRRISDRLGLTTQGECCLVEP